MSARQSVVALVVAALGAAACGGTSSPSQQGQVKLTVGYSNISVDFLAPWVAKEAGIFEKNGLDVDLELVSGGTRTMTALLSGQMQITQQGVAEALTAAA